MAVGAGDSLGAGGGSGEGVAAAAAPITPSGSVVRRLDGVGDDEHECTFVVLVAAYPDRVDLGCLCRVANGRRWWVVCTQCCVVQ